MAYKGINIVNPATSIPPAAGGWGTQDFQANQNILDNINGDTLSPNTADLTGHKHTTVYDSNGNSIIDAIPGSVQPTSVTIHSPVTSVQGLDAMTVTTSSDCTVGGNLSVAGNIGSPIITDVTGGGAASAALAGALRYRASSAGDISANSGTYYSVLEMCMYQGGGSTTDDANYAWVFISGVPVTD